MSVNRWFIAFSMLLLLCIYAATAIAAQPDDVIVLTDGQDEYPIGLNLEILEDKEKQWTIEDVTSPAIADQFVPSQEAAPGFGFTDSAYWVRFHVRNEAREEAEWVLIYETIAFFIDYYLPSESGNEFEIVQTGTRLPFHTRDVPVGRFVFRLPVAPQESKTVHMRFASEGTMILPLSIMTETAFASENYTQQLSTGFLYGMLLILSVYNLVLYFYLRDSSYLYYVLYFSTILLGMMALYGFGDQYLWPNWPAFGAVAARSFLILSFTFGLLFSTSFLRTTIYAPRLHRIMRGTAAALFIVLGLQFIWFRETAIVHVFLMIGTCCLMIVAGLLVWQKGYRPARYFLLGWTLVLAGFAIIVLTLVDALPFTNNIDMLLQLGLIVLALVLSIGLADRINLLRQDKEAAQLAIASQRMQIARDLHDSVTQSLYSTNLFAEAGRETVETGDVQGASHYFRRIGATTQQALKEMRLFLYELRPPDVVEDGLVDSLQKRLDAVEKRSGMEARLFVEEDADYPDVVQDQFYRIAQEALNNVVKHAQADEVKINLYANDTVWGLKIVDNGLGFDLDEVSKNGGLGLKSMQERATKIDGDLIINTAPNEGTIILVEANKNDE